MAKTEIETLVVAMEARTKEFEKAILKAEGTTKSAMLKIERQMQASSKRMGDQWASIGRTLKGGLAGLVGGFTVGALTRGIEGAISSVAGLADEASRAGVSVEELQQLVFAGRQEGTDQAGMVGAMQRLNVEIGEALEGSGDLEQRLALLGIPIRKANGEARNTRDIFLGIADAVAGARNQQEQAVLVQQALGRGAADMLPFLKQGGEAIRATMALARESGAVIDEDLVKRAKAFDDAWVAALDSASQRFKGFVVGAVAGVADIIEGVKNIGEGADTRTFANLAEQAAQFTDELAKAEERITKIQATMAKGATATGRGGNPASQLQDAEIRAAHLREMLAEVQGRLGTINALMLEPLPALRQQAEQLQKALAEVNKQVATRGSSAPGSAAAEASLKQQLEDTLAAIAALETANAKMRETGARMGQIARTAVQRLNVPSFGGAGGGTVPVTVVRPCPMEISS